MTLLSKQYACKKASLMEGGHFLVLYWGEAVVSESKASSPCEARTRAARRRRCKIRRFKCYVGVSPTQNSSTCKRLKTEASPSPSPSPSPALSSRDCDNASENSDREVRKQSVELPPVINRCPKYGVTSVCGRRRDMEDAVSIHPSFFRREGEAQANLHFFGVYDGHGCSHVAMSCKEKLHEILAEELGNKVASEEEWKDAMDFTRGRVDNTTGHTRFPSFSARFSFIR